MTNPDADELEEERTLRERVKAKVLALLAWVRAEVGQASEEISPDLSGSLSRVSIPARAIKPLALAGVLLFAAVALPAAPLGNDATTGVETTEEPVVGTTYDAPEDAAEYRRVVESALGTADANAPEPPSEVRASAGTQTMSVATTIVDGEPAIVLEDDRTHSGRWVSVPTSWFKEELGEVPKAAHIDHDSGETYAAPLNVRGESATFYVKKFSTNTVTFSGEVVLTGDQAGDGTQYQYDLNSTSGVEDPSITLTGVNNTAPASTSLAASNGDTLGIEVGGTAPPRNETVTLTGKESTASGSLSPGTVTDAYSTTVDIGGNQPARDASVTFTGKESTTSRSASGTIGTGTDSITVNGNQDVTIDITVSPKTVQRTADTGADNRVAEPDTSDIDIVTQYGDITTTNSYENVNIRHENGDVIEDKYLDDGGATYSASIDVSNDAYLEFEAWESWADMRDVTIWGETRAESATLSVGSSSASFGTVDQSYTKTITVSPGTHSVDLSTSNGREVEYDLSWTDHTITDNPSVSIGGSSASVSGTVNGGETVTKSISLSSGSSQSVGVSTGGNVGIDASWTEVTATEDPSATVGGSTVSHTGVLAPGETVEEPVDLSTGSQSADVSVNGPVDVSASWTEVAETRDPAVELNGNRMEHTGTLADGETVSLSASNSSLVEGTNTVNISTNSPASGPASLVGLRYEHPAATTTSASVSETTWSQSTTVLHTWADSRSNATATLPMNERVVGVRNVEVRTNGSTWSSVSSSNYDLDGTDLVVELGDVSSGETTEVRATGSKVRVTDGEISVLEPTTGSDQLDTRLEVNSAGPNFTLSVDETIYSERIHYATNATWGETTGESTFSSSGEQSLTLPSATAGGEATVRTWPVEVAPVSGSVSVSEVSGDRTEPGFTVRGDGNSEVGYTFVDAADATPYVLYSVTDGIARDQGLASSPITLSDDNSDEELRFIVDEGGASGSGSGSGTSASAGVAPMEAASGGFTALQALVPDTRLLLLGLIGLAAGIVAVRRSGVVDEGTRGAAAVDAGQEVATTAGGLLERVLENEIVVGALVLGGAAWVLASGVLPADATLIVSLSAVPVALFLVLQQFDRFDFRIWLGSTALVGVFGINALAPELASTIAEETGVLIVGGALLLGWRAVSAFRAEAETPDKVNRVELVTREDDDS